MSKNEVQVIGLDIGRGFVKGFSIYNSSIKKCCFKSVISIGRNLEFEEYENPIYIEVAGAKYFVGDLAEKEGDTPISNSKDSKVSITAEKLLYAALSKIAVSSEVKIMLGVPNKCFNKKVLGEVVEKYKGKEIEIKDLILGSIKKITILDVAIFRESDSALLYELRDSGQNTKPCGMVTIGFRTSEFTYFDKGLRFNDKKSKSMELGNKSALEHVRRMIQADGLTKTLIEIDSNEEDYIELKKIAYEGLNESITQEIDNFWINTEEMDIFIAGGTALKLNIKEYKVVDDAQMSTAKGLYLVGNKMFG